MKTSTFQHIQDQIQSGWHQFRDLDHIRDFVSQLLDIANINGIIITPDDRHRDEFEDDYLETIDWISTHNFAVWVIAIPGIPDHIHRDCVWHLLGPDNYTITGD